jgi:hypothetical protein
MIVLDWLRSSPHRWKTFVSNRVAYIQEKISPASWRYIRSSDNPADCASRGLLPAELKNHPLWWNGLTWLCQHPDHWPIELSTASPTDDTIINSETRRAVQSDQQESNSEQALQIIGHVVAKSYAHKRSKHGRRQFMVSNAT